MRSVLDVLFENADHVTLIIIFNLFAGFIGQWADDLRGVILLVLFGKCFECNFWGFVDVFSVCYLWMVFLLLVYFLASERRALLHLDFRLSLGLLELFFALFLGLADDVFFLCLRLLTFDFFFLASVPFFLLLVQLFVLVVVHLARLFLSLEWVKHLLRSVCRSWAGRIVVVLVRIVRVVSEEVVEYSEHYMIWNEYGHTVKICITTDHYHSLYTKN